MDDWEDVPAGSTDEWEDVSSGVAVPTEIKPVRVEGPKASAQMDTMLSSLNPRNPFDAIVLANSGDFRTAQNISENRARGAAAVDKATAKLPNSPKILPEIATWDPAYRALQANSDPRSIANFVGKTAADPYTYMLAKPLGGLAENAGSILKAGGRMLGNAAEAAGNVVGKIPVPFSGANLGEIWNAGKNLKSVQKELARIAGLPSESALAKGTAKGVKAVKTAGKSLTEADAAQAKALRSGASDLKSPKPTPDAGLNALKEKRRIIETRLKDVTRAEASDYKEAIKKTFANVTKTYGEGIEAAEADLAKRGVKLSRKEYAEKVIGRTLEEAEARGISSDDPVLTTLRKLQNKLLAGTEDEVVQSPILTASGQPITKVVTPAQENLTIQEMKNLKNGIYGELSGGVRGGTAAVSDAEDQVANMFLRNHGEYLGPKSPALQALNKEAAPMFEARRWAYKNFRPYRPMEIEKGAKILEKIASGGKVNPDDVGFLRVLEKGSGRFQGTGTYTTKSTALGKEIELTAKTYSEARQRLIDAADFRIAEIEKSINADVATLKSAGEDSLEALRQMKSKEVELLDMKKRLEDLRKVKLTLIGLAAGTTVFGKKALSVAKAVTVGD